jgi:hypothetical protein
MRTAQEIDTANNKLLVVMKNLIFEISQNIQLAEGQISKFPIQVFIVAKVLEWRMANIGFSSEVFPDFQDKEYVFETQRKIVEGIEKTKQNLTLEQIQESEKYAKYVVEMPLLQQAIPAKTAFEELKKTEKTWKTLETKYNNKSVYLIFSFFSISSLCGITPLTISMLFSALNHNFDKDEENFFSLVFILFLCLFLSWTTFKCLSICVQSSGNYSSLKKEREELKRSCLRLQNGKVLLQSSVIYQAHILVSFIKKE